MQAFLPEEENLMIRGLAQNESVWGLKQRPGLLSLRLGVGLVGSPPVSPLTS